jgi:hypothetical protein
MYWAREIRGNRSKERIVTRRSFSALTMSWASSGERNERCVEPSASNATSGSVGGFTRRLRSPVGRVGDRRADRFVGRVVEVRELSRPALHQDFPALCDEGFHGVGRQGDPRFARARLLEERNFHSSFLAFRNKTLPMVNGAGSHTSDSVRRDERPL